MLNRRRYLRSTADAPSNSANSERRRVNEPCGDMLCTGRDACCPDADSAAAAVSGGERRRPRNSCVRDGRRVCANERSLLGDGPPVSGDAVEVTAASSDTMRRGECARAFDCDALRDEPFDLESCVRRLRRRRVAGVVAASTASAPVYTSNCF